MREAPFSGCHDATSGDRKRPLNQRLLRLDAALYEPAPPRKPGQRGRPRLKGERLPNLSAVAEDPNTVWKPTTLANWYGESERTVEIASETAVWYSKPAYSPCPCAGC